MNQKEQWAVVKDRTLTDQITVEYDHHALLILGVHFFYSDQLPTMKLNPEVKNIFDFKFEDLTLEQYQHHPPIKAPVAV